VTCSHRSDTGSMDLQADTPLTTEEISHLVDLIRNHSGIDYHPGKSVALCNAVVQRMHQLNLKSKHEFLTLIRSRTGQEELKKLVSLVVVQKTSFFRDRPQFDLLEKTILPEVIAQRAEKSVRVWSAGCATGEEPYSIAMVLRRNSFTSPPSTVLATDIARPAINEAIEARYRKGELETLSKTERAMFLPENGDFRLSAKIRQMVEFKLHNLVSVPFPVPQDGLWDIIFCRNVLIYFNRATVREIIMHFREVLAPGGHLFLGVSESLFKLAEGFDLQNTGNAFVYRKSEPASRRYKKPQVEPRPQPRTRPLAKPIPAAKQASKPSTPQSELELDIRKARRMLTKQDNDGAFKLLFDLTGRYPEATEPYLLLGECALNRGALWEALSWYQAAAELRPLDIEGHFLLAVVHHRIGLDQEAAGHLRKLLFLDGKFALGHYYLGEVTHRLGDIETAVRSFRNAIRISETSPSQLAEEVLGKHHLSSEALLEASRARLRQIEIEPGTE